MVKYHLGKRRVSESAGALRVTIPKMVRDETGVKKGDEVDMIYDDIMNTLIIRFPKSKENKYKEKEARGR